VQVPCAGTPLSDWPSWSERWRKHWTEATAGSRGPVGRKPQSKLMSRRTERPYKVDGTGKLARHSAAPCSVPEINGPVVQQKFTSLLRETSRPSSPLKAGALASNDPRAMRGVSRGHSTESNEPGNTGRTHNSGRAELVSRGSTATALPETMKPPNLSRSFSPAPRMSGAKCSRRLGSGTPSQSWSYFPTGLNRPVA